MELRLRRYRTACFAILALGLASLAPRSAGGGSPPLAARLRRLRRRRPLHAQQRPPGDLGRHRLGRSCRCCSPTPCSRPAAPSSPALMWFALPAVTLGARFEPRGIAIGTAYILALLLLSTYGLDPAAAADAHQDVIAAVALVLSTVILSGALVESDRAHRRRSTLDPLTGLFNRNALEQRLAELDGQPAAGGGALARAAALRPRPLQAGQRPARPRRRRRRPAGGRLHDARQPARRRLDLPGRRRGDPRRPPRRRPRTTRSRSPSACALAVRERRPVGVQMTVSIGVAVSRPGRSTPTTCQPGRRGALRGQGGRPRHGRLRRQLRRASG